jgi:hypothetical protein
METEAYGSLTITAPSEPGVTCITVTDRAFLIAWVARTGVLMGADLAKPFLVCHIDACDQTCTYRTPNDIPDVDVPCPCGNPAHWMIRYDHVGVTVS